ncbi:MAG: hypothetical protein AAF694_30110 [Bacteroidota bacterium]
MVHKAPCISLIIDIVASISREFLGIIAGMLILANQLGAIGFILRAKGVARLKDLEDKDLVEYLIIGIFMSAFLALLVGLIFQSMLFPERFVGSP